VLYVPGDDEEFAGFQDRVPVPEADDQPALHTTKNISSSISCVPHERALELGQAE
jgi:hypothetical protein